MGDNFKKNRSRQKQLYGDKLIVKYSIVEKLGLQVLTNASVIE